ncbi:hypothetical protein HW445_31445, partial [Streptomyces sp. UH6]|nr:hypothetical protein [Streptomyces sp. UH6]
EQTEPGTQDGTAEPALPEPDQVAPANPDAAQGSGEETIEHQASLLPAFDGAPRQESGA